MGGDQQHCLMSTAYRTVRTDKELPNSKRQQCPLNPTEAKNPVPEPFHSCLAKDKPPRAAPLQLLSIWWKAAPTENCKPLRYSRQVQGNQEKNFIVVLCVNYCKSPNGLLDGLVPSCVPSSVSILKTHPPHEHTVSFKYKNSGQSYLQRKIHGGGCGGWKIPPSSLKCKVISQFACKMTQIVITFSHGKFASSKPASNGERTKQPPFSCSR